jgi:hypothetical protein
VPAAPTTSIGSVAAKTDAMSMTGCRPERELRTTLLTDVTGSSHSHTEEAGLEAEQRFAVASEVPGAIKDIRFTVGVTP